MGIVQDSYRHLILSCLILLFGINLSLPAQINPARQLMLGRQYLQDEEYTQAIRSFNLVLNYNPDHSDALFLRGYAKFQLSDYYGATEDFTKAYENNHFLTDALYYRAIAAIEMNQYQQALKDLIQAIDIDDRQGEYFHARAYLHTVFGDTLGAISDYEKSIQLNSANPGVHLNLGLLYLYRKDYYKASEHANKAMVIDPSNSEAHLLKANIAHFQQQYPEAISEYLSVLEQDSVMARAAFYLGICYQEIKKYDSAEVYFNKTILLNPDNSVCYYHRALLYTETERYSMAIADLDKVIALNPNHLFSYHLRGVVKIYLKDYSGAESDFSKAIELYPLMLDAYQNRAYARGLQNKIDGYYSDKNKVDSLLAQAEEGMDDVNLDYFKSITDLRSDFTNAAQVQKSRIQYIEQQIRLIPVFHPVPESKKHHYALSLSIESFYENPVDSLKLCLVNFDYLELTASELENMQMQVEESLLDRPESEAFRAMKSILLSWQREYDSALKVLLKLPEGIQPDAFNLFLQANYHYLIGSIANSLQGNSFSLENAARSEILQSEPDRKNIQNQEAIDYYTKAIDISPDFIPAYFNRAIAYSEQGDYARAIADLDKCIEAADSRAGALFNRGLLYIGIKNYTLGCADLSKAGELGIANAYRVIYKYCSQTN